MTTQQTDCELLELAAKAAGHKIKSWWEKRPGEWWVELLVARVPGDLPTVWNPLHNDGDALRLVVKMRMAIYPPEGEGDGVAISAPGVDGEWIIEECTNDVYAATRRAIVRAAAEIGKAMP